MSLVCAKHNAEPLRTQELTDIASKERVTCREKQTAEELTIYLNKWESGGTRMMSEGMGSLSETQKGGWRR